MKKLINAFLWIIVLLVTPLGTMSSNNIGLLPVNHDGFETGDWRNFRPHYAGNSEDWIRPRFSMNQSDPISGNYSLQWESDQFDHEWFMLSNAFYLEKPVTLTIDFRVSGNAEDFEAGLLLMESKEEFAGIKVTPNRGELYLKGDATIDKKGEEINILPERVYTMSIGILNGNSFQAEISDQKSGNVIVSFTSISFLTPVALSMYVKTGPNSNTIINFDNLRVKAAEYKVQAGQYVRSPQFVVLPRLPDVKQDQGNWVGGHSSMVVDGKFNMWYRIRDNIERGRGYGFAQSKNGIDWKKHENNPLFSHHLDYASNEKICVLKVDGLYRAWYAVDTGHNWYTAYATSKDGIKWEQHGLVIDETYCKDPEVIYLDGTYYLYSIMDHTKIGIYTSSNGMDFTKRNSIDIGVHAHVAAFYETKTGLFHLYTTGGFNGVNHSVSEDGIHFGFFTNVMNQSSVGLDDWDEAGVTYLSFLNNELGHVQDADALPFYYQARNTWDNNIPDWRFHGGERIVLGGKFEGIYLGVPAIIHPDNSLFYESFPFLVTKANGFSVSALRPVRIIVDSFNPNNAFVASGTIQTLSEYPHNTQIQIKAENCVPGKSYQLFLNNNQKKEIVADNYGTIMYTISILQNENYKFQIIENQFNRN